jgi:ubiquinone/menaquinone biosynthesis C-methylase UbiE
MNTKERCQFWDKQAFRWADHEPFGDLRWDMEKVVNQETKPFTRRLAETSMIIDLGAGANNRSYFGDQPEHRIYSVDLSKKMLKLNQSDRKIQADVCQPLPIGSETVDLCTSFFLMRYLSEQEQESLLVDIKRILKPKSWFLIIDIKENQWGQQQSVFNTASLNEAAIQLGFKNVSGSIETREFSKYISTGFGGWSNTVECSYGKLFGQKE